MPTNLAIKATNCSEQIVTLHWGLTVIQPPYLIDTPSYDFSLYSTVQGFEWPRIRSCENKWTHFNGATVDKSTEWYHSLQDVVACTLVAAAAISTFLCIHVKYYMILNLLQLHDTESQNIAVWKIPAVKFKNLYKSTSW